MPLSEVGGFKKGDRVQWTGSDDDIPEGTVGTVVGLAGDERCVHGFQYRTNERVLVECQKGTWVFRPAELRAEVN